MAYSHDDYEAVAQLVRMRGWAILREYIEKRIRIDTDALLRADLDAKPCEAGSLQGRIERGSDILKFVDRSCEAYQKGE